MFSRAIPGTLASSIIKKRWCLSVCLFRVNTKTTEPIRLKFCTKIDYEAGQHIAFFTPLKSLWASIRGHRMFQGLHFNTQRLKCKQLWIPVLKFDTLKSRSKNSCFKLMPLTIERVNRHVIL